MFSLIFIENRSIYKHFLLFIFYAEFSTVTTTQKKIVSQFNTWKIYMNYKEKSTHKFSGNIMKIYCHRYCIIRLPMRHVKNDHEVTRKKGSRLIFLNYEFNTWEIYHWTTFSKWSACSTCYFSSKEERIISWQILINYFKIGYPIKHLRVSEAENTRLNNDLLFDLLF